MGVHIGNSLQEAMNHVIIGLSAYPGMTAAEIIGIFQ